MRVYLARSFTFLYTTNLKLEESCSRSFAWTCPEYRNAMFVIKNVHFILHGEGEGGGMEENYEKFWN